MRKIQLLNWLKKNKPDIVLLQETKCLENAFPKDEIEELGYNLALSGQKTFNGVAILSLFRIDEKSISFKDNPVPEEARYIETVISIPEGHVMPKACRVISVYIPNGGGIDENKYKTKLRFLDALHEHMKSLWLLNEPIIIGGDFNIAPEDVDTYNGKEAEGSVLFNAELRGKFKALLNLGYYDSYRISHPKANFVSRDRDKTKKDALSNGYTWWDYREGAWYHNKGMRLDHILLSPEICDTLKSVHIDRELRSNVQPSDHVPVICEIYPQ